MFSAWFNLDVPGGRLGVPPASQVALRGEGVPGGGDGGNTASL